ncbi:ribonuclease T2-like [Heteronotia binoei]|uniref:ribonuclease T2-like n=1 Tax=Heteronotia binoei TaxID=13085 RepID=UPI00292CCA61|nr:ribonuclease T2-like [Heteronotia binoei]
MSMGKIRTRFRDEIHLYFLLESWKQKMGSSPAFLTGTLYWPVLTTALPRNVIDCCPYWHLFPSDLVDLAPELIRSWPTFTNLSNFQFWEKEWRKHGTCAGCTETLNSPNKYFRASLFLHSKYNIDRAFRSGAIVPSCNSSYQLNTFKELLQPVLGDRYELQCVIDTQGRQILVQIQVSIYSNFSTGCLPKPSDYSPYKPCRAQSPIFYFPPNQDNPRNPCP